jgi:hypothetical protein
VDIIRILNMDEYNPRKDRKKHSWFRVDNTIPHSKKLHRLNPTQKWLWICLVAFASSEQRDWTEYDIEYFKSYVGGEEQEIRAAIAHFENKQMIVIESIDPTIMEPTGNQSVTSREPDGNQPESGGVPTDGQTDGRTLRTDGQTTSAIPHLKWQKFNTLLSDPANVSVLEALMHVPLDVQEGWLIQFHDPEWLLKTIRKAITKRKARGLTQKSEEWGSILTSWLYNEHNPPQKPKVPKYVSVPGRESEPPPDLEKISNLNSEFVRNLEQKIAGGLYANQ